MAEDLDPHVLKRYDIVESVGKGAYGIVWRSTDLSNGTEVALKKIIGAFRNVTDSQRTFREIMFLLQLKGHDNVIRLKNILQARNNEDIYLIFDFMDTDLHSAIRAGILGEIHKKFITYQLLRAVKYMHSGNLLHRDLKPSNILLNRDCIVKVADFGLARSIAYEQGEDDGPVMTDYIATRWYRAPEVLLGSTAYTTGVDMWSIGCILGELLLGKTLFQGSSTLDQISRIISTLGVPSTNDMNDINSPCGQVLLEKCEITKERSLGSLFGEISEVGLDLLSKLLQLNPTKRISAQDALMHDYVSAFHKLNDEPSFKGRINIPFDDNKKLTIQEYRDRLYTEIARRRLAKRRLKLPTKDYQVHEKHSEAETSTRMGRHEDRKHGSNSGSNYSGGYARVTSNSSHSGVAYENYPNSAG